MIESTGMSGRLPVLSAQVDDAQSVAHVTWKTWPGVDGVFALNPPTAAYAAIGAASVLFARGSNVTSRTGRFGSTELPPVTFVQIAWFATPVPRLRPIWTFPSFVPTT